MMLPARYADGMHSGRPVRHRLVPRQSLTLPPLPADRGAHPADEDGAAPAERRAAPPAKLGEGALHRRRPGLGRGVLEPGESTRVQTREHARRPHECPLLWRGWHRRRPPSLHWCRRYTAACGRCMEAHKLAHRPPAPTPPPPVHPFTTAQLAACAPRTLQDFQAMVISGVSEQMKRQYGEHVVSARGEERAPAERRSVGAGTPLWFALGCQAASGPSTQRQAARCPLQCLPRGRRNGAVL